MIQNFNELGIDTTALQNGLDGLYSAAFSPITTPNAWVAEGSTALVETININGTAPKGSQVNLYTDPECTMPVESVDEVTADSKYGVFQFANIPVESMMSPYAFYIQASITDENTSDTAYSNCSSEISFSVAEPTMAVVTLSEIAIYDANWLYQVNADPSSASQVHLTFSTSVPSVGSQISLYNAACDGTSAPAQEPIAIGWSDGQSKPTFMVDLYGSLELTSTLSVQVSDWSGNTGDCKNIAGGGSPSLTTLLNDLVAAMPNNATFSIGDIYSYDDSWVATSGKLTANAPIGNGGGSIFASAQGLTSPYIALYPSANCTGEMIGSYGPDYLGSSSLNYTIWINSGTTVPAHLSIQFADKTHQADADHQFGTACKDLTADVISN